MSTHAIRRGKTQHQAMFERRARRVLAFAFGVAAIAIPFGVAVFGNLGGIR